MLETMEKFVENQSNFDIILSFQIKKYFKLIKTN